MRHKVAQRGEGCTLTMFWTQDGEWVSQLPEEIHEGKPHHTSEQKLLSLHYTDTHTKKTAFCDIMCEITSAKQHHSFLVTVFYFQYPESTYTGVCC